MYLLILVVHDLTANNQASWLETVGPAYYQIGKAIVHSKLFHTSKKLNKIPRTHFKKISEGVIFIKQLDLSFMMTISF